VGKSYGKRPLVKIRCRWECNIKMVLNGTRIEDFEWIHLAGEWNKGRAAEILPSGKEHIFDRVSWTLRFINGRK
jgi:hypothetical protein